MRAGHLRQHLRADSLEQALTPGDFERVKDRVDLVQLVGTRVTLRKAGRTFKGLCPFHAEKTPSFTVDPDRRTFRCFGCGENGDVFDWLMKTEGVEKSEALAALAERSGVELSTRPRQENERAKRVVAAHDTALFYFRQALRGTPGGARAARYLADRGISPETIDRFALGYAPATRDGLLAYLRRRGFSDEEALASGIVLQSDRGLFDRFHERLMVPIRDPRGRVVAFGGRALDPGQPAKYINSPQTILFNKSATLYALDVARTAIRRSSEAVIVEGYFDAIACHQAGLDNVVASMGTALTEGQYRLLDDMKIERAVVAFDADAPGALSAERRGVELAGMVRRARAGAVSTRTGLGVHVAELPTGDPDELARADPERLRRILGEARPVLDFVIDRIAARHDLREPSGRRRFLAEVLPLLTNEPDALTRELYLGRLSGLTGVTQEALRDEAGGGVRGAARRHEPGRAAPTVPENVPEPQQSGPLERFLMAQLIQFPEEAARIELEPEDLADPQHWAVFEHLRAGGPSTPDFPAHLAAAVAALGASAPEPVGLADAGRVIEVAALRLRERNLRRRLDEARASFARASGGDMGALDDEVARLGEELEALMRAQQRSTVLRAEMEIE